MGIQNVAFLNIAKCDIHTVYGKSKWRYSHSKLVFTLHSLFIVVEVLGPPDYHSSVNCSWGKERHAPCKSCAPEKSYGNQSLWLSTSQKAGVGVTC